MGDLLTARKHFDRAMAIGDRQGRAAALPEFVAATEIDPSMADAWLGRIAWLGSRGFDVRGKSVAEIKRQIAAQSAKPDRAKDDRARREKASNG